MTYEEIVDKVKQSFDVESDIEVLVAYIEYGPVAVQVAKKDIKEVVSRIINKVQEA